MVTLKLRDYRDRMDGSSGLPIHWACSSFESSLSILLKNSEQLLEYLENPILEPFWPFPTDKQRKQKHESDKEVIRLLHNYVAAAKTLIDHSRRYKKYLSAVFVDSYQEKIKLFSKYKPSVQLVQNLRNYLLHVDNPHIVDHLKSKENKNYIGLVPSKLLLWSGWNRSTKKYLERLQDNKEYLYLSFLVNEYNSEAIKISTWLFEKVIESHLSDLEMLYETHKNFLETGKRDNLLFDPFLAKYYVDEGAFRVKT